MKKIIRGKEVHRRVFRQGDSLVVTIPPAIIEKIAIRAGDQIKIEADDQNRIVIEKIRPRWTAKPEGGDTCQR